MLNTCVFLCYGTEVFAEMELAEILDQLSNGFFSLAVIFHWMELGERVDPWKLDLDFFSCNVLISWFFAMFSIPC